MGVRGSGSNRAACVPFWASRRVLCRARRVLWRPPPCSLARPPPCRSVGASAELGGRAALRFRRFPRVSAPSLAAADLEGSALPHRGTSRRAGKRRGAGSSMVHGPLVSPLGMGVAPVRAWLPPDADLAGRGVARWVLVPPASPPSRLPMATFRPSTRRVSPVHPRVARCTLRRPPPGARGSGQPPARIEGSLLCRRDVR